MVIRFVYFWYLIFMNYIQATQEAPIYLQAWVIFLLFHCVLLTHWSCLNITSTLIKVQMKWKSYIFNFKCLQTIYSCNWERWVCSCYFLWNQSTETHLQFSYCFWLQVKKAMLFSWPQNLDKSFLPQLSLTKGAGTGKRGKSQLLRVTSVEAMQKRMMIISLLRSANTTFQVRS